MSVPVIAIDGPGGAGKGTVSRAVARLEDLLEVELLHRTTHHVALSTAGGDAAVAERLT